MPFVTLRISWAQVEHQDDTISVRSGAGPQDYTISLFEGDRAPISAVLTSADLNTGPWRPDDILERFGGVGKSDRNHTDFAAIAETLYNWLLPAGPVRNRWNELNTPGARPRLFLDIEAQTLASLPWEFTSRDRLGLRNGIYRLRKRQPVVSRTAPWPLRILILVGCPTEEEEQLGIGEEVAAIERQFLPLGRSVDVQRLERPQKSTLREWVSTFHPHVLHFAGHGGKLPGSAQMGLRFSPPDRPWIWTAENIEDDLATWMWFPRFVFLNACRSASEHRGSWSVQNAFLCAGTEAVVGMQADIQGDLAGYFAANLYEQCALGKSLADAIFEARKKLAADKLLSNEYIDWALPSMVSIAEGLTVFNPQSAPATPQFQQCREFRDARFFADCREPRRKCTNWIYPADGSCSSQNVLLITGERKSGKSHLLKWCMETWALGGARVRYIELHGQSKSLLDILRQIRKGEPYGTLEDEYLHHPLPPEAFKRFTWELTTLLRTGELGEWIEADHLSGPEDVQDDDGLLTATSDKRLEPIVCTRFWAALKAAAGGRPLILVFDRLGGPNGERTLSPPDFKQLVLNLLVPIAQEANSSIKLAFSASSAEAKDYSLEFLPEQNSVSYQLPIDFTDDQLAELAAEAVWFRKADKVKQAAKALFGFGGNDAKGLGRLKSVFDAIGQDPEFAGVRMR